MGLIHIDMPQCPHCKATHDFRLAGLCSGLGTPLHVCPHCRGVCRSGRAEWPAMSARGKRRFLLLSALYVILGGGIGGTAFVGIEHAWSGHRRLGWMPADFTARPMFWIGFALWAAFIAVVQSARVLRSIGRSRRAEQPDEDHPGAGDRPPPLWLRMGWQLPFLFLLVGPLLLSWLIVLLSR